MKQTSAQTAVQNVVWKHQKPGRKGHCDTHNTPFGWGCNIFSGKFPSFLIPLMQTDTYHPSFSYLIKDRNTAGQWLLKPGKQM